MNWGKILSIAMIVMCVAASVGYFVAGDYRRALYWISAAAITITVTF